MKAAPLSFVRPCDLDEVLRALAEGQGATRVLAGGQSLVPMLHMRLMRPETLIDLNVLEGELGTIEVRGTDTIIGALVRYKALEESSLVSERVPLLQAMVRHIGDRQVRNRGTLGGALAQADPTGEMALACLALGATVVARSVRGERTIAIESFFEGAYSSALEHDELLVAVRVPLAPTKFAFFERGRKHNDFALLSLVVLGDPDDEGRWHNVRVALGAVNDRPVLAVSAAARLEGERWDERVVAEAAQLALEVVDAADDMRASAEYRRHLVPIHLRRVLNGLAEGVQ